MKYFVVSEEELFNWIYDNHNYNYSMEAKEEVKDFLKSKQPITKVAGGEATALMLLSILNDNYKKYQGKHIEIYIKESK